MLLRSHTDPILQQRFVMTAPYTMSWSRSSQWRGAAEHDQRNDGDYVVDHDSMSDSEDDYKASPGEVTWWKRKRAGTGASEHYEEQRLGGRRQKRGAELQHLGSEIRFFKLNEIDANYKDNHTRIPDLSADIRIVFPTEEYIGAYASHGQSKTVFVIRSSGRKEGRFDGAVLKIRRGYDIERAVMRHMQGLTPKLHVCIG